MSTTHSDYDLEAGTLPVSAYITIPEAHDPYANVSDDSAPEAYPIPVHAYDPCDDECKSDSSDSSYDSEENWPNHEVASTIRFFGFLLVVGVLWQLAMENPYTTIFTLCTMPFLACLGIFLRSTLLNLYINWHHETNYDAISESALSTSDSLAELQLGLAPDLDVEEDVISEGEKPKCIKVVTDRPTYLSTVLKEVKNRFGCPADTSANRLAVRKFALDIMTSHKVRPTHIAQSIDLVVELTFVQDDSERMAARVRRSRFVLMRQHGDYAGWLAWASRFLWDCGRRREPLESC